MAFSWNSLRHGIFYPAITIFFSFVFCVGLFAGCTKGGGADSSSGSSVVVPSFVVILTTTSNSLNAGQSLTVTASITDTATGNVKTDYVGTLHFASTDSRATIPADYQFLGADAGVHTFTGLTFVSAGVQTLTAIDTVTSNIFGITSAIAVSAGALSTVDLSVIGTSTLVANGSMSTILEASISDVYANPIANELVTLTIPAAGGTATNIVLSNTNGKVDYNLTASTTPGTYSYSATAGSITSAPVGLLFTHGPAAQLVFSVQPSGGTAGAVWPQQPAVMIEDAYGNLITSGTDSSAIITASLKSGSGPSFAGPILGGITNVSAVGGIATFTDLKIDTQSALWQLTATKQNLLGSGGVGSLLTDSSNFVITPSAAVPTSDIMTIWHNDLYLVGQGGAYSDGGTPVSFAKSLRRLNASTADEFWKIDISDWPSDSISDILTSQDGTKLFVAFSSCVDCGYFTDDSGTTFGNLANSSSLISIDTSTKEMSVFGGSEDDTNARGKMALSPDGSTLYVAGSNQQFYAADLTRSGIAAIDIASQTVTDFNVSGINNVQNLAVDPLTGNIFAAEKYTNGKIFKLSPSGTGSKIWTITNYSAPKKPQYNSLALSGDGSVLFVGGDCRTMINGVCTSGGIFKKGLMAIDTSNTLTGNGTTTGSAANWNSTFIDLGPEGSIVNTVQVASVGTQSTLFVGGNFTTAGGGASHKGFMAYRYPTGVPGTSASWDLGLSPGEFVNKMLIFDNLAYLSGSFTTSGTNNLSRANSTVVDLTSGFAF